MIVSNPSHLSKIAKDIQKAPFISFDVETTGLNPRRDSIIGLGIAFRGQSYYFIGEAMAVAAEWLHDKRLVAWNAHFDLEFIRLQLGVDLWKSLHADVLMLKHTLDENPPFGLKEVAVSLFGHSAKQEQEDLKASVLKNGGKWGANKEVWMADVDVLAKYCKKDCELTLRIFQRLEPELRVEGLYDFFYVDEVMPLYTKVTRHMVANGVPVDVPALELAQTEIALEINKLHESAHTAMMPLTESYLAKLARQKFPPKHTGGFAQACIQLSGLPIPRTKSGKFQASQKALEPYKQNPFIAFIMRRAELHPENIQKVQSYMASGLEFNINSKDHLRALFFEELKETPLNKTDGGKPQVDEEFMEVAAKKYEWAAILRDYNKLCKLKATYIDRILELQENGIFYPTYKQHGTVSGRFSGDCQQLPRKSEPGQFSAVVSRFRDQIRSFFIAGDGCAFIDADYESLEPHIFAHVSGAPGIQAIFERGDDFYSTIAIATERIPGVSASKSADNYLGKVSKLKRQMAKAYSLGIPYGMEAFLLGITLEVDQAEAQRLIDGYLGAYPELKNWMTETDNLVRNRFEITTEVGRKRRFRQLKSVLSKWNYKLLENSLDLWQAYHEDKQLYAEAKKARRIYRNCLNNAKNFQIQSLAASIVNRAAIQISDKLPEGAYIVAQVHDQIIVRCPKNAVDNLASVVQTVMESQAENLRLSVKLKAPAAIGTNFSDAH